MCAASTGASSSRRPVSTLTTPAGTSDVATASASSIAASGCASEATTTTAFPPTSAGTIRATRPSSAGSSGAITATTPVGSGTVKLKYGPATGLEPPSTWASLSAQPAYQTTRSIARATSRRPPHTRREGRLPRLHRLGQPIEHLAAVVGRRRAPCRVPLPRRDDRVARVLAGGPRDVVPLQLERPPRLRARERAADVELVRLADGQPRAHSSTSARRTLQTPHASAPSSTSFAPITAAGCRGLLGHSNLR